MLCNYFFILLLCRTSKHFTCRKEYKLKVEPADEKLRRYKSNCLRRITRINNNRMAKIMLNYGPNGRRRLGRPLKRLLDKAETSLLRPNS